MWQLLLKKSRESGVGENIRFMVENVANINEIFETGEVERLYINFCDPWRQRKKWAKRRLTHRNFLNLYEVLFGEKGGEVFMKTDNQHYLISVLMKLQIRVGDYTTFLWIYTIVTMKEML